jgi:hypothetical protein
MKVIMQSRLLIINCPSEYFVYIPMGTFGLCDYLSQKDMPVKLLNLAVYKENETDRVLHHYLELFQPTHIGLIFHWQDTAEGFLWTGEHIRSHFNDAKIIAGGFTAGYFGENLLEKCTFVDYVIKGDPELPLKLLLSGTKLSKIPNLIYRKTLEILSNEVSFFIDQGTLSNLSFSDLTCLYDYEMYVEAINKKLGFPIFVGNGCNFTCTYCGGSCNAFRLHSGRGKSVARSISAIIEDLKRLKSFTRKMYLCHENDRDFMKALFRAMKKDKTLIKIFQLNYGAWQLLDREFLELYKELFILAGENKSVFELSPEVFDDKTRSKTKHAKVNYSIKDLKDNLHLISNHLGDSINVSIFFSRYHDNAKTYSDMKKEIAGIFRLKHDLFSENIQNIHIAYDHLSTDIASRYWEKYVKHPKDFDTLVSAIRKLKAQEQYRFPFDNLCIYMPETLTEHEIFRCELLIFILKTLEKYFNELFHVFIKCLNGLLIDVIEEIIIDSYSKKSGNVFKTLDHCELLDSIRLKIISQKALLDRIPFVEDLTLLNIKKARFQRNSHSLRSHYQTRNPKVNRELISVHDYDYLDLTGFFKKLYKEGVSKLRPEKTVFIFLADEVLSMTYETYNLTLKEFEKGISVEKYYKIMERRQIFTVSYHKDLIAKLFRSNVLY